MSTLYIDKTTRVFKMHGQVHTILRQDNKKYNNI